VLEVESWRCAWLIDLSWRSGEAATLFYLASQVLELLRLHSVVSDDFLDRIIVNPDVIYLLGIVALSFGIISR
jgi:hypothetical protein